MEGLEVTIKPLSYLYNEIDNTLRFDAEHYQVKYDEINKLIQRHSVSTLRDLVSIPVMTGHTPSMKIERFYGGNIPFIKTDNLRSNNIVQVFTDYLTDEGSAELKGSELKKDDVILTIIGATTDVVGRAAIIRADILPAHINQNIALIRVNPEKINSEYFNVYLNTKYGRGSLHHHSRQTEQVNLNCREVERVLVPLFNKLPFEIEKICLQSKALVKESAHCYTQAETLLLETLGMADFTPSSEAVNIKSFKDSFVASGRLDAEYYQPKYEQVVAHIKAQAHQPLIELVDIQKSVEPGSDAYCEDGEEGLSFLRVADFSKQGLTPPQKHLKASYVSENWDKLQGLKPRKDTILFSKDGSVGEAYCLTHDLEAITSGAVLHLSVKNPDELLPEYLTLALNSKLVKMQSERDAGGSIILHWRVSEIENVVVPLVDMTIQRQIADLVQHSFALKAQSTHLLDVAKRAVEMAIEQDEAAAFVYIASEVSVI